MKKIVLLMIFFVSSIIFCANDAAMVDYIVKNSGGKTSRADAQTIVNTVIEYQLSIISLQHIFMELSKRNLILEI